MQETWFQSLIQEDPTCCGAMKPVHRNYGVSAIAWEPRLLSPRAAVSEACTLEAVLCNKKSRTMGSPCTTGEQPPLTATREKATQQRRPSIAENK